LHNIREFHDRPLQKILKHPDAFSVDPSGFMKKHLLKRFPKCCFAKKEQLICRRNLISIDSMVGRSLLDSQLKKV